jgi:hypothetical protein
VHLTGTTLTGNVAPGVGGGAWSAGALTATRTTLRQNDGGSAGGGAHAGGDLTATDVRVQDNTTSKVEQSGGGAGLDAGATLRLTRTSVTGNTAQATFLSPYFGIAARFTGGGVRGNVVVAVDSTVSGNTVRGVAIDEPPRADQVTGGGVFAATSADLTNTTVSGNTLHLVTVDPELTLRRAGGVSAETLTLRHATIADNAVRVEGTDGVPLPSPETGTLQAGQLSSAGSVVVPVAGQRTCVAGVVPGTSWYTVLGDDTCGLSGTGVRTSAAGVALGPVADNGGPVATRLPAAGSTLVDAVPAAACVVPRDARGITRPQGAGCDIGAVEVATA